MEMMCDTLMRPVEYMHVCVYIYIYVCVCGWMEGGACGERMGVCMEGWSVMMIWIDE